MDRGREAASLALEERTPRQDACQAEVAAAGLTYQRLDVVLLIRGNASALPLARTGYLQPIRKQTDMYGHVRCPVVSMDQCVGDYLAHCDHGIAVLGLGSHVVGGRRIALARPLGHKGIGLGDLMRHVADDLGLVAPARLVGAEELGALDPRGRDDGGRIEGEEQQSCPGDGA